MELEYLKTANSLGMWISCIPAVLLVLFQAWLFLKRAWATGPKMGVTNEQMKEAAKSSLFASIGPSIVIVSKRDLYEKHDTRKNRTGNKWKVIFT